MAAGLALLVGIGLATPIVATVAAVVHVARAVAFGPLDVAGLTLALPALALALLGPGAYSIDARRFGRRLVVTSRDGDE
jgi:hypothetical protein